MSSSKSLYEISSHEVHHESSSSRRNSKWVIDVKERLEKMDKSNEVDHWKRKCIYQIPACVKDLNKKAYKPQAVSFSPYRHGEDRLNQMEEHKHRMDALHRVGKHLVDSYDWLGVKWLQHRNDNDEANDDHQDQYGSYNDQFLQLMMLDGCFMLEILRTATGTTDDYAFNDPIFSYHGKLYIMPYIRRDMLMLQNQLPMLLLDTLLAVETGGAGGTTTGGKPKNEEFLNRIISKFSSPTTPIHSLGKCLHVLDVYRKNLLQEPRKKHHQTRLRSTGDYSESSGDIIRSAMELHEAGIRFKTSKTMSLRDISFRGYCLHFFMDNIIDSAKDVSLLHSSGIIRNAVGSDKAVAKLFNKLSKDVTLDPDSSLDKVHKKVNDYCKKKWNEWHANLIHTYFRSPWAILSVVAALFLMALTIAQTFYSIYTYYKPRN
ncbi:hypothetical protein MKX01_010180 [Papaver californicum]|nr:hypothetical protein MKX01_010180 [Papaver californicum]